MKTFLVCASFFVACANIPKFALAAPCQGIITVPSDHTIITSAGYPTSYEDYTFCRYVIQGPENQQVRLTFSGVFGVEESPSACAHDKVGVYDPEIASTASAIAARACRPSNSAYTHGPYCGQTAPANAITLRGNRAVVEFCTDYSGTDKGWAIQIEFIPLPTVAPWIVPVITLDKVAAINVLQSPNYPLTYNDRQVAQYIIRNPNRNWIIQLKSKLFDLGSDGGDRLVVLDVTNNVTRTFYGVDQSPQELDYLEIANSAEVHVNFITDASDTYRGFIIEVTSLGCAPNLLACDNNVGCYHPNASCNGVDDCADGSDEKWQYCAPECGSRRRRYCQQTFAALANYRDPTCWQPRLRRHNHLQPMDRLSASHCFTDRTATIWYPAANYRVKLGSQSLDKTAEADGGIFMEIEKIICHPYYRPIDHDVCLLKLKETIPFRKNIAPACLPPQDEPIPPAGTECLTSGWGTRVYSGSASASTHLRQVYVPVVSNEECNRAYDGEINERMMCSGTAAGGLDTCQGDSGGPYVCPLPDGRWALQGVVSFGAGCGDPGVPGVYARTAYFTHWIVDTIAANSN
ncbi:putative Transmembrane protease serine 6 [Hypsibius exemplaris]|uniref:Transmembrane protease serine 6 n=1 Tax=Hypsibius exemplaris TaxID=2072580 RepID=A0A9X6RLV9_HYPEX|nr:putative Transmembrane protease serine 6 [Hypsibius exemplaris]